MGFLFFLQLGHFQECASAEVGFSFEDITNAINRFVFKCCKIRLNASETEELTLLKIENGDNDSITEFKSADQLTPDCILQILLPSCGKNFHKRCVYKIPNNCTRQRLSSCTRFSSTDSSGAKTCSSPTPGQSDTVFNSPRNSMANCSDSPNSGLQEPPTSCERHIILKGCCSFTTTTRFPPMFTSAAFLPASEDSGANADDATLSGRPIWMDRIMASRIKVPHTFLVHCSAKPAVCQHCKRLLHGLFKQAVQCKGQPIPALSPIGRLNKA
ncbi:Serine/threonine-protein kinase D3 [Cichlidogyrus casuarinus]|uniref:Serine/threonine-protein kinase D3 n=1 Tax=Cichlidogyrus casuarinus TaxID=1844966 RepID=A0ABD2QMF8_9PLAT